MVAEPLPSPISKLPKAGDNYGAGAIPAPTDQDLTVALVWHPHKLGPNSGGWVCIQIPFGDIFDLPINTADSIGLINQVQNAMGSALASAGEAKKSALKARNLLTQMQAALSAALSWSSDAMKWALRSRSSAAKADSDAHRAMSAAQYSQAQVNKAKRNFSDSRLAGFIQSNGPRPQRVPRANDANKIIASQVFGS